MQHHRRQIFSDKVEKKCIEDVSGRNLIVAYSDASFPLLTTSMDGGSSAHGWLMVLLLKRVCIIMANEYRTTKACPNCKDNKYNM